MRSTPDGLVVFAEEEARQACGPDAEIWQDGLRWGVNHPVNRIRQGGSGPTTATERSLGFCSTCGMELLPTGACGYCDD